MAKKEESNSVVRIKAFRTSAKKAKKTSTKQSTAVSTSTASTTRRSGLSIFRPFVAIGQYFKGAWVELRQVHWPTRRATWSLTGAVLLFTAFFIVLILLLDAGFKYLFEQILG